MEVRDQTIGTMNKMTWENYLKSIDTKEINDGSEALKAVMKRGRDLGIQLEGISDVETANKAAGATTTTVGGFHNSMNTIPKD